MGIPTVLRYETLPFNNSILCGDPYTTRVCIEGRATPTMRPSLKPNRLNPVPKGTVRVGIPIRVSHEFMNLDWECEET